MSKTTSIAVLVFKNISNDSENDFFCEGISEEIITAFSKIEQLKVISRTSSFYFKDHPASIKEIGERLGVDIILEGSVRVGGPMLRISAQLINVEEDSPFWTQTWDRKMENLFEIQDEISLLIADQLREHLGHLEISDHLVESPTEDLGAYKHYLKGRYHFNKWNPQDVNIAITEFDQAVAIDKNLIYGHLGLADAYSFLAVAGFAPREEAWMKAITALNTAKKIDPNNAALNFMLANQAFFTEANFTAAMQFALKALRSVPTHVDSQRFVFFLYILCGQLKKAKDHIFYAKSIDPLNPETLFYEAYFYYRTAEYAEALNILQGLLKDNDKNLPAQITSLYVKIKLKQLEDAKGQLEAIPIELITPDERLGLHCLIEIADTNQTPSHLTDLIENATEPMAHQAHSYLFMAYCMLEKFEEAYEILDKVFKHNSSILLLTFSDPLTEKIRATPLYQKYHQKLYPLIKTETTTKKTKIKSPDKAILQSQLKKLTEFVNSEQPFLNPALTLRLLANQISIHPNKLSWLLNEQVGKNFNEFINQKRIEHFKKLVVDPANSHISIIGLAYESGFNSKTVFNTVFKKEVGMTPKQYQKKHS
ncbi:MAG: helix-turn-helix domain-containing protein [Bacteroidota bacterium]